MNEYPSKVYSQPQHFGYLRGFWSFALPDTPQVQRITKKWTIEGLLLGSMSIRRYPSGRHIQEELVARLMNEGYTVGLVCLDFAKPFDSINQRFLLAKLRSSGIEGRVLNWIEFYPFDRSLQVQSDGVLSEEAPCLRFKIQLLSSYFFRYK